MKLKWCWRCKMEVPMLNEQEFAIASQLYGKAFKAPIGKVNMVNRFNELLEYYNTLTGWNETVPNAIMHHRINDFGPDCPNCSKPLRTRLARYCVQCGFGKDDFKNQSTEPLMKRRKELFNDE